MAGWVFLICLVGWLVWFDFSSFKSVHHLPSFCNSKTWSPNVLTSFPLLQQNICDNLLNRARGYFGSQFQRFQLRVTWPHCFWACGKAGQHMVKQSCSHHGDREAKQKRRGRR
jgi:hypothetical protein